MERTARYWFACLVVTPLGLLPIAGCGNSPAEPSAQVEAERGIPPLLLPRVDGVHTLAAESSDQMRRTTLADHVVLSETPRRLPPVDYMGGNQTSTGARPGIRVANARVEHDERDSFQIIPLPPVTETYEASDATPYLASVPQSVVLPQKMEPAAQMPNDSGLSDLDWPEEEEVADSSSEGIDELDPVTDAPPQLDASLEIPEPVESESLPRMENSHEASLAAPDASFAIRPLPPVSESEPVVQSPELVEVPAKSASGLGSVEVVPVDHGLSQRAKAMRVVSEQAAVHVRRGMSLASRNAHYSARSEFIQALRLISQALDVANDSHEYTEALSAGLRALDEADDFVPHGTQLEADLNLGVLIRSHRTPVLKDADPQSLRPIFARQEYYNYAQKQLAHSVEDDRSGSMALYGLAKMRASLAEQLQETASLELPKAMALYQAAMMVDGDNFMASNELGVLLARYGQYESARSMLEHSVRVQPQAVAWHNLAVVYQHLGRASDVQFARSKQADFTNAQRVAKKPSGEVVWKSAEEFSRSTARSQAPVAQVPTKTVNEQSSEKK